MDVLRVRRLADRSPEGLADHPPDHPDKYPTLGLDFVDDRGRSVEPPAKCRVSTGFVDRHRAQGGVVLENENVVHRPGGPPEDLYRVTHTFKHADALLFKTHDGRDDVRYRVVHQPDKYVDTNTYDPLDREPTPHTTAKEDAATVTDEHYGAGETRVDWFYDLELDA